MFDEEDDDEIFDINELKTNILISLVLFLNTFKCSADVLSDIFYRIISIDNVDELLLINMNLFVDDQDLEKILKRLQIKKTKHTKTK